ncbi:MAG: DRTGG domain-containing protein [Thermodesulfovibrionales bacterium]|nr:DRTGG domain-containing protein [Thermodesulfovibrionales bacterium]
MKLSEIASNLNLEPLNDKYQDREVKGAYVSDLLSDVMANARPGEIWITLQIHINIVAVAVLKNLPAIIITNNRKPDEETLKKASQEGIAIFKTGLSTFETAGRLYKLLIE